VRTLDQPALTLLPDTLRAQQPFFSPDGSEVRLLRRQRAAARVARGRASHLVVGGGDARGATWGEDGTIVYSASQSGALMRVSASGGTPSRSPLLDPARASAPTAGRGSCRAVASCSSTSTRATSRTDDAGIELVDLDSGRRRALDVTGAEPRFAEGRLLFVRRGRLHAAPLDLASARLTSGPVVLAQGVHSDPAQRLRALTPSRRAG
jgi:hypothetical protein